MSTQECWKGTVSSLLVDNIKSNVLGSIFLSKNCYFLHLYTAVTLAYNGIKSASWSNYSNILPSIPFVSMRQSLQGPLAIPFDKTAREVYESWDPWNMLPITRKWGEILCSAEIEAWIEVRLIFQGWRCWSWWSPFRRCDLEKYCKRSLVIRSNGCRCRDWEISASKTLTWYPSRVSTPTLQSWQGRLTLGAEASFYKYDWRMKPIELHEVSFPRRSFWNRWRAHIASLELRTMSPSNAG